MRASLAPRRQRRRVRGRARASCGGLFRSGREDTSQGPPRPHPGRACARSCRRREGYLAGPLRPTHPPSDVLSVGAAPPRPRWISSAPEAPRTVRPPLPGGEGWGEGAPRTPGCFRSEPCRVPELIRRSLRVPCRGVGRSPDGEHNRGRVGEPRGRARSAESESGAQAARTREPSPVQRARGGVGGAAPHRERTPGRVGGEPRAARARPETRGGRQAARAREPSRGRP